MGNKYLSTDNPIELEALHQLIAQAYKITLSPDNVQKVLQSARQRCTAQQAGQSAVSNARYDPNRTMHRQFFGLLGEATVEYNAVARGYTIAWNPMRNTGTYDMLINGHPYGVKCASIDDAGNVMTPQIDTHTILYPQILVYAHINDPANLASWLWDKLLLHGVYIIGVVPPADIIAGTESDYGVSSNSHKGGFTAFTKLLQKRKTL